LYVTAARLPTGLPKLAKGEINKFEITFFAILLLDDPGIAQPVLNMIYGQLEEVYIHAYVHACILCACTCLHVFLPHVHVRCLHGSSSSWR
jgi:hypothetical protein